MPTSRDDSSRHHRRQGTAGGSSLAANGSLEADPADFQAARVKFSADITQPRYQTLARLFGIEGQTDAAKIQARLTLCRRKARSRDGLESVARLTALGAEASFDGTLTRLAPALAAAGNLQIEAASADRVLAAWESPIRSRARR